MKVQKVKLSQLKTDLNCVKHHNKKNIQSIKKSLKTFDQYSPLVVNKNTYEILKGVGTYLAMKQLDYEECYVVFVNLDQLDSNQLIVLDNRTSELSQMDNNIIQQIFYTLESDKSLFTGFSEKQIENIMNQQSNPKEQQDLTQKINLAKIKCPHCGTQFFEK